MRRVPVISLLLLPIVQKDRTLAVLAVDLEADLAWRPGPARRLRRLAFGSATALYLGAIGLLTAAVRGDDEASARDSG